MPHLHTALALNWGSEPELALVSQLRLEQNINQQLRARLGNSVAFRRGTAND